jgi:hypothetical protein
MSIENVTTALQAFATTGNGESLVLREPRFVRFKIQGNGPISGLSQGEARKRLHALSSSTNAISF